MLSLLKRVSVQIESCVVTDFEAGKILYSYSSDDAADNFNSRGKPVVKIGDEVGFSFSPLFQVGATTDTAFPNKDDECYVSKKNPKFMMTSKF